MSFSIQILILARINRDNRITNTIFMIIFIITIVVVVVIVDIDNVIFRFEFDNIVNINYDHLIIKVRLGDYNGYNFFYYFIVIE